MLWSPLIREADIYYIDYLAQHDEGHTYKIISKLVFNKYYEPEIWLNLFEKNVISRERLLEQMSIIDEGTTYFKDVSALAIGGEGGGLPGGNLKSKEDNNDDSADKRTREEEQ